MLNINNIRIAVCDDMDIFLDMIRNRINTYDPNIQIDEYSSGEELLTHFKRDKYDAVILDIEMKKINGLQTAHEIHRLDKGVVIAFHTSYNYLNTSDYDIGPYEFMRKKQSDSEYQEQLDKIFTECAVRNTVFNSEAGDIPIKSIIYFKRTWRKLIMYTDTGSYILSTALESVKLPKFIRIHKRYYVNSMFIDTQRPDCVVMQDGTKLPFSQKYRKMVSDFSFRQYE